MFSFSHFLELPETSAKSLHMGIYLGHKQPGWEKCIPKQGILTNSGSQKIDANVLTGKSRKPMKGCSRAESHSDLQSLSKAAHSKLPGEGSSIQGN